MGKVFGRIIMMLCFTVLLASAAQAKALKAVYLRDGGIIECQKVWQANGKVLVLVNRDTLVELAKDEVDLQKTFGKKPAKVKKAKVGKKKPVATVAKPEAAAQPPAKPGAAPEAVKRAEPAAPVGKPVPAAQPQPAPAAVPPAPAAKPAVPAPQQTAAKPAPPPPPPEQSFLTANLLNIVLGALLVLLLAGYAFYKKRQKG